MSTPASRTQQAQRAPATQSTQTQTQQDPTVLPNLPSGTLRLRAEPEERRHIQWAEDVVDNEGMGKKSSKVCCIYHKPTEVGESADEDSSDSSSDSDSEPDNSTARPGGRMTRRHNHHHDGDHGEGPHGEGPSGDGKNGKSRKSRRRSPNAYEKQPQYKKKDGTAN